MAALVAQASSLGPMTVQSALGEPLRAEIDLVDLTGAEAVRSILAIAPPATYRDLGLAYPPGLEGANVTLVRRRNGTYGALVTSSRPVGGPEVDIVLSLTTTSGQQLRNYRIGAPPDAAAASVPLRPPGATAAAPAIGAFTPSGADASQPPLTVTTEAPRGDAAPTAAMSAVPVPEVAPAVIAPAVSASATAPSAAEPPVAAAPATPVPAPAPAPDRPPVSRAAAADPARAAMPVVPATVTVVRGETATSIARRVKPGDVDDAQAVMALYRLNRQAFSGSVHELPEGAVLRLPDPDQMRELAPARARAALRAQRPDPSRALVTVPAGDRLRLSEGGRGGSKELDGGGAAAARQRSVAFDAAMNEAQSRIAQLQANVAGLTKLIEAKERQRVELEAQVRAAIAPAAPQAAAGASGTIIPVGAATATLMNAEARKAPVLMPAEPAPEAWTPGAEVIAAVTALLLLGLLAIWMVRRRRRLAKKAEEDIEWPTWAPSQN
jgi:pilus assembly protein FimV